MTEICGDSWPIRLTHPHVHFNTNIHLGTGDVHLSCGNTVQQKHASNFFYNNIVVESIRKQKCQGSISYQSIKISGSKALAWGYERPQEETWLTHNSRHWSSRERGRSAKRRTDQRLISWRSQPEIRAEGKALSLGRLRLPVIIIKMFFDGHSRTELTFGKTQEAVAASVITLCRPCISSLLTYFYLSSVLFKTQVSNRSGVSYCVEVA